METNIDSQNINQSSPIPDQFPVVELQKKKSNDILLYIIAAVLLVVLGALGFWVLENRSKEKEVVEVDVIPTPTKASGAITPTTVAIQTPTPQQVQPSLPPSIPTTNIYEGWKTYKHPTLGYEFKYPLNAALTEIGEPNKNDCVSIKIGLAYLSIKSPAGVYGGCVVTGMGAYDKIGPIEESVFINGKSYLFEGNSVNSSKDPDANKKLSEFLRLSDIFGKESVIEYGGYYNQVEINSYLGAKQTIKQIVSSIKVNN